jgi:hypothetical protein
VEKAPPSKNTTTAPKPAAPVAKTAADAADNRDAMAALLLASEKERLALVTSLNASKQMLKKLVPITVASVTALVLSIAAIFFYPRYYWSPVSKQENICQVVTRDKLPIAATAITDFARGATIDLYTYNYLTYNRTLGEAANRWLSTDGRKSFFKSLDESKNLRRVINDRLSLVSTSVSAPQLLTERDRIDGYREWEVGVPILLEFFVGGKDKPESQQAFIATVVVRETDPSATNPNALQADKITLRPDNRAWSLR